MNGQIPLNYLPDVFSPFVDSAQLFFSSFIETGGCCATVGWYLIGHNMVKTINRSQIDTKLGIKLNLSAPPIFFNTYYINI